MNKWFKVNKKNPVLAGDKKTRSNLLSGRNSKILQQEASPVDNNYPQTKKAITKKTLEVKSHITKSLEELQSALKSALEVSRLKEKVIRSLQEEIQQKEETISYLRRELITLRVSKEAEVTEVEIRKKTKLDYSPFRNTFPFLGMPRGLENSLTRNAGSTNLNKIADSNQKKIITKVHRPAISAEPSAFSLPDSPPTFIKPDK